MRQHREIVWLNPHVIHYVSESTCYKAPFGRIVMKEGNKIVIIILSSCTTTDFANRTTNLNIPVTRTDPRQLIFQYLDLALWGRKSSVDTDDVSYILIVLPITTRFRVQHGISNYNKTRSHLNFNGGLDKSLKKKRKKYLWKCCLQTAAMLYLAQCVNFARITSVVISDPTQTVMPAVIGYWFR